MSHRNIGNGGWDSIRPIIFPQGLPSESDSKLSPLDDKRDVWVPHALPRTTHLQAKRFGQTSSQHDHFSFSFAQNDFTGMSDQFEDIPSSHLYYIFEYVCENICYVRGKFR
jgi:hypothetical protein